MGKIKEIIEKHAETLVLDCGKIEVDDVITDLDALEKDLQEYYDDLVKDLEEHWDTRMANTINRYCELLREKDEN